MSCRRVASQCQPAGWAWAGLVGCRARPSAGSGGGQASAEPSLSPAVCLWGEVNRAGLTGACCAASQRLSGPWVAPEKAPSPRAEAATPPGLLALGRARSSSPSVSPELTPSRPGNGRDPPAASLGLSGAGRGQRWCFECPSCWASGNRLLLPAGTACGLRRSRKICRLLCSWVIGPRAVPVGPRPDGRLASLVEKMPIPGP